MVNHDMELAVDDKRGFIKIPNLLFEALICAEITYTQRAICDFVIRHTYGWNRKEVSVSINEFTFIFKKDRSWVIKQLHDLIGKKILLKTGMGPNRKSVLKINPNIYEWDKSCFDLAQLQLIRAFKPDVFIRTNGCSRSEVVGYKPPAAVGCRPPEVVCSSPPPEQASSQESPHLQAPLKTTIKTNIKTFKNNKNSLNDNTEGYSLAELLLEKILLNNPDFQIPDLHEWAVVINRMIEVDKRKPEAIRKAIIFAQEDEFWHANIINAQRLRTQFELLDAQRNRKGRKKAYPRSGENEFEIFLK